MCGGRHFAENYRPADTNRNSVAIFAPEEVMPCRYMPIACTQCGHRFEKIQHFKSEQELVCPVCQGVLERPLTAPRLPLQRAEVFI